MTRAGWSGVVWSVAVAAGLLVGLAGCTQPKAVAAWDPAAFRDVDTLQFLTLGPDEGPHWSTVWLVVLDGQVWIRLGSRAAGRMQANTAQPFVSVRSGGKEYEHVRTEHVPAMVDRVQAAMAEKYPTDVFVRWMSHPLTMRLTPEPSAATP